ncbi:hypothetical protein MAR_006189 [Mya arenaria]|uniref:Sulfotransferase domain-containing protein n=1 Tax=Mya arenaria TaxID=6604 RepID=A0ABY7DCA7_MYAAR|nr:hypothetical protein MAR_006189 [Mya arenaria]
MAEKEAQRASTEVNSKPRFELPTRVYKGIMMMVNEVEQIEMMDTRPDDIWVCTHPRSGTTLTQEMSYLIETLDFETANNVYLDDRFPMIDILDDRLPFYRSKAGVWKDLLTPDAVKKIDLMVQELEGTGLVLRDN